MANAGRGRPEYLPDPEEAYEHERERWEQHARPDWVKEVERTDDGTLLVVEGMDGKRRGVRIPSKPIRPS